MNLKQYLSGLTPKQRKDYAYRSGTKPVYLVHLANGHSRASAELARRLHEESDGQVSLCELRPDLWPEVA